MRIREHLSQSLKLAPAPSPWPRMILCALSVTPPLIIGYLRHDESSAIYGGLFAFTMILNDHFGPLGKRVLHLLTVFFFLACAFSFGLLISGHLPLIMVTLFIMAFILGKSKGLGLELERLLLTATFQLLTASQTPGLKEHFLKPVLYASFSLANYIICLMLVYLVMKHAPNFQRSKRQELLEAIKKKDTIRYALTLATISCLGLFISNYYALERGHWMVSTILIVMMPDKTQSYQRSFQRIFGTLLGGVMASVIIYFTDNPLIIISFSAIAAFLAPLGLIKNYWLGNTFIAAFILLFLDFGHPGSGVSDFDYAIVRLTDIVYGSIIGVIGTFIAHHKFTSK
ncbi:FUSC family protein [Peredibacter starrii]|uniref:FUSC family protein n=1 Tax=Peredibacter starrii TaxID=28202 RepID=A0AAX4HPE2_9BACT|nr:FUSC family protein [Peredibacter starrii]WPU65111.1 FUSC family protein [Peredibacter starrii]